MLARAPVFSPSLVSLLALASSGLSSPVLAAPPALIQPEGGESERMVAAQEAYQEGERAYRLGDFEAAAGHFEQAYELSALPDILYNIGLSHLRWYDIDPNVAHLRKAKVVLQNYLIELDKDPALGDADEAEGLIAQIEEKIAAAEQAPAQAEGDAGPEHERPAVDPGRKLRVGGAVGMGVGGVFVAGGVVSGVMLGLAGARYQSELSAALERQVELGCAVDDTSQSCAEVSQIIDIQRRNGRTANVLAVSLAVTMGGVGVIGLVTGAVLYVQGKNKRERWRVSLVPGFDRAGASLTVFGRF